MVSQRSRKAEFTVFSTSQVDRYGGGKKLLQCIKIDIYYLLLVNYITVIFIYLSI